ncbi:MAG: RNA 2',3'-cyclic phosphodiesterase [Oscillospiraceae bacterium]|nr:RNA 2',3'-cyclic phosphodiesterase [Oscillospiraceae bacterium]
MRLFIAIQLDSHMKDALAAMQTQLRARRVGGNYTKTENLHLTLAFIGEYGDPDRVLDVMRSVPFAPFPIALDGFGCFGDLYWCGLALQDELTAYVGRLRRELAEADIPFDRKRFSPHITLLRRASAEKMPGVTVPEASMTAKRVSLMRSERGKNGMVYTELGAADARGANP